MSQIFMEMILKILGTIFYCFYLNLIIYIIYTQQNLKLMLFNQKMQSIFNIKSDFYFKLLITLRLISYLTIL